LASPSIPDDPLEWIATQLSDPACKCSLGGFGAVGMFPQDADAEVALKDHAIVVRAAGATLRIERGANIRLVAFETISSDSLSWNHGVAICTDQSRLLAAQSDCLRETGPDKSAIDEADRHVPCFAAGVASQQMRVLLRTADNDLLHALRHHSGLNFFDLPASVTELGARSPVDWIVETPAGRLEFRQRLTSQSPNMPCPVFIDRDLLASGLTHARGIAIPPGSMPCGYIFPPHPARAAPGMPKHFDEREHLRFQQILDRFGIAELVSLKRQTEADIAAGTTVMQPLKTRHETDIVRVVLRQRLTMGRDAGLEPWMEVFDRPLLEAVRKRADASNR